MDIFFQDLNEVRLPPEEVRLNKMQAEPLLDGSRVKVILELTPFIKKTQRRNHYHQCLRKRSCTYHHSGNHAAENRINHAFTRIRAR